MFATEYSKERKNMNARIQAWLDQDDARIKSVIRRHGWSIEYIGGGCSVPGCDGDDNEGPPFAYTVGLFGLGHPELLAFSLDADTTCWLFNTIGASIRDGDEGLIPGQMLAFEDWEHQVIPEEVPHPGEIVFGANRFYERPPEFSVPVFQLSYDDYQGRWPWEENYSGTDQPRPGTFQA